MAILALTRNLTTLTTPQSDCTGRSFQSEKISDPADHHTQPVKHILLLPYARWQPLYLQLTEDGTMNRLLISIYCLEGIAYTAFDNDYIYQPCLPNLRDPTASYAFTPGRK